MAVWPDPFLFQLTEVAAPRAMDRELINKLRSFTPIVDCCRSSQLVDPVLGVLK